MLFFDTETAPIVPGFQAPPLVCLQFARDDERPRIVRAQDGAAMIVWRAMEAGESACGHNTPYDLLVLLNDVLQRHGVAAYRWALRVLYAALDAGRVFDTFLRALLKAAADGTMQGARRGQFSLDACAQRYGFPALDKPTEKEKGWDATAYMLGHGPASTATALSYWELRDVPVAQWPERHVKYALEDVEATRFVFRAQPNNQPTEAAQMRGAWALHVTAANGLRVDPERVARVRAEKQRVSDAARAELQACGLLWSDKKGDHIRRGMLQQWVLDELGAEAPKTDGGAVATDAETLGRLQGHPQVAAYLRRAKAEKLLGTFLPALEKGLTVHTRYTPIVSSNRTSSSGPNVQNLPQEPGVRECFVPRPGRVFSSCDYKTLELRTFAQVCHTLGFHSRMREALLAGEDLHRQFADSVAAMTGSPVERGAAKGCNFGFPGGMGPRSAVAYLKGYKAVVTEQEARALKNAWVNTWTEAPAFFRYVSSLQVGEGIHNVTCPVTGYRRGGCFYTAACNTHFQGLAGHGNKAALYEVVKACHLDPELEGTVTVASIHDEALCEHPETRAAEHAQRVADIMARTMERTATPDVPQIVEPTLMRVWSKEAEPVFDDENRLIPWDAPEAM